MKSLPFILFSLLACISQVTISNQHATTSSCLYSSCPATQADRINIHIVAHTHDDVGWLKTVDQYYYGTKKRYSNVAVQFILDSVIPQLVMDKSKRFIYVEMSFFTKWWKEQNDAMRSTVRSLVQEGRLEFINGGWCMNDEATVNYQSTIEQMTLGLKFLNQTFGSCGLPKVGWQIDPFGHTNEQASLFAQFGFDGMFFTREDWEDKKARVQAKSLDFMWHGDKILGDNSGSIFTSIFRDGYDAPSGYCFDTLCLDDNLVDNKESFEYNIGVKGDNYIKFLREYASSRNFNHVLVPMGGDFQYSSASHNFNNLDKLIKYVKLNAPDLNIFYSTPSCYQYSLYQNITRGSNPRKLPEKYDDFLPYDSTPTIWWSGFFSSRPSVKLIERQIANLLPVTRLVSFNELLSANDDASWTSLSYDHESTCLNPLWEILGDLQHHDAITGTEKQHVNDDYVRRSTIATDKCSKFMGQLAHKKILENTNFNDNQTKPYSGVYPVFLGETSFCSLLNISQCEPIEIRNSDSLYNRIGSISVSESAQNEVFPVEARAVLLNIYNPLAMHIKDHDIRLPCNGICDINLIRAVHLSTNTTLKVVRLPLPSGISTLAFRDAITTFEYLFYIDLPPLSRVNILLEDQNNDKVVDGVLSTQEDLSNPLPRELEYALNTKPIRLEKRKTRQTLSKLNADEVLNEKIIIKLDAETGTLIGLKRIGDATFMNITQKFGYYFPSPGKSPGAYTFRPNSTEATFINKPSTFKIYRKRDGSLIEIHQKWADWIWQTIRVDGRKNYIEFDYVVGPVPLVYSEDYTDPKGREVITRYTTTVKSDHVFMTDSNGRQLLPRRKINNSIGEDLGGSFYPVVSTIMLKDLKQDGSNSIDSVAILVDRPQAGTSLDEGDLELLIHRRHTKDDEWGVGEALNEPGEDGKGLVTRGKHRLYIKFSDSQLKLSTKQANRENLLLIPDSKESNLDYEKLFRVDRIASVKNSTLMPTYIAQDPVFDELRMESIKHSMKPIVTFDKLRVPSAEFFNIISNSSKNAYKYLDFSLLNNSFPPNIHLLTLQPWAENPRELLIRLENLNNPLTVHPFPQPEAYRSLVHAYNVASSSHITISSEQCDDPIRPATEVDIEYMIRKVRIVDLKELRLGANVELDIDERLQWYKGDMLSKENCRGKLSGTSVKLAPREIRTFLARFEYI